MSRASSFSRRARAARAISSAYLQLKDTKTADVLKSRRRFDKVAGLAPIADRVQVERTAVSGLAAEWLSPVTPVEGKVLLYLHGGAYILGSCRSHRNLVSHMARFAGIRALVPEYRLAPEHPFPAAVEDAAAVYRALLGAGIEPANMVVSGDSAGGGLTMAMLLSLRDAGEPMPAAAFLLSPWLDLTASGESMHTRRQQDPWFHEDDIDLVARYYCKEEELGLPLVSPVFADLRGMPPVHIQVGDDELLLSDATRLVDGLREAGSDVHIEIFDDMWHVFQMFVLCVPESRAALETLCTAMQEELSKP